MTEEEYIAIARQKYQELQNLKNEKAFTHTKKLSMRYGLI
jgi:hypothetical protein